MNDLEPLFQVVFFVVLFLGWILKTIAEQRRQRPAPPPPSQGEPGEQGLPEPTRLPPPHPQPVPPRPRRSPDARPPVDREPAHAPPAAGGPPPLPSPAWAPLARGRKGLETAAAMETGLRTGRDAARHRTRRRSALVRLTGGREGAARHDLVRAGILWREILGYPRALTGPYRPEALRRFGRR